MAAADVEMKPADISSVAPFAEDDKDLYVKLKALQRQMEFLEIQVRSPYTHNLCAFGLYD